MNLIEKIFTIILLTSLGSYQHISKGSDRYSGDINPVIYPMSKDSCQSISILGQDELIIKYTFTLKNLPADGYYPENLRVYGLKPSALDPSDLTTSLQFTNEQNLAYIIVHYCPHLLNSKKWTKPDSVNNLVFISQSNQFSSKTDLFGDHAIIHDGGDQYATAEGDTVLSFVVQGKFLMLVAGEDVSGSILSLEGWEDYSQPILFINYLTEVRSLNENEIQQLKYVRIPSKKRVIDNYY